MENRKSYLLFSSEMWSGGFVILNMYFYLLRYSYFRNVFLLSILEPGTVWIINFYHLRNSKKSIVRSGHGYEPHAPWLMYLFTLYKLWRNTLGNSLMNIQLKKSDIEKLNKNKDSCENMQFICIGQRNEIPNEFSVCVISCRYQLPPLLSIDTVYYSVDTLASLLLKVILLLKMKFLCKLWTSNLGSHGSPVNFLHQLESEKVPLDTISHLSSLPVTKLLWYQKRAEWAVSLNASMFNVTISSHGLFKMQFHM